MKQAWAQIGFPQDFQSFTLTAAMPKLTSGFLVFWIPSFDAKSFTLGKSSYLDIDLKFPENFD